MAIQGQPQTPNQIQPQSREAKDLKQLEEENAQFWENVWTMLAEDAKNGTVRDPKGRNIKGRRGKDDKARVADRGPDTSNQAAAEGVNETPAETRTVEASSPAESQASLTEAKSAVADLKTGIGKIGKDEDFGTAGLIKATEII